MAKLFNVNRANKERLQMTVDLSRSCLVSRPRTGSNSV